MQCSCIRTEKYLKICKSETQPKMGRDLLTTVFLTLGIIPIALDPQISYVLFQILYIRFTPYTFSLFNLIMA